jgi:hypothetical protein
VYLLGGWAYHCSAGAGWHAPVATTVATTKSVSAVA